MNDYWFVLGTTTALRGYDYCCSLTPRSFRSAYSRLFGVKQYRVPAVSTLERLSCLALKAESQRRMENDPVLVKSRISIGTFSDQYWFRSLLRIGIKVADEWQISLDYVRGSNIYVRGYLDLRAWSLRLRT